LFCVKLLKGKGCRDADVRQSDYTRHGWGVGEGVDFFTTAQAQDRAADKEERDVGAYLGGYF
jgi:hypothetical protein